MPKLSEKVRLMKHAILASSTPTAAAAGERTSLLRSQTERRLERELKKKKASLTGGFVDFASSSGALLMCLAAIMLYFVVAIIFFSLIFEPDWSIIDSLYFAVVTFTTVGYGDLAPESNGGKIFTIFFVLFGIVILGVALGIIGDHVVQAQEAAINVVKLKAESRIVNLFESDDETTPASASDVDKFVEKKRGVCGEFFEVVIKDGPIVILILILAIIMGIREHWSIVDSIYYAIITTTTVGYGDMEPTTQSMRLYAVFFIPFSVAVLANILGRIAGFYMDRQSAKAEKEFLRKEFTLADLQVMDTDGDGGVCLGEFLAFMLVAMQKVDKEAVDELVDLFGRLDVDKSGQLQKDDLIMLAKMKHQDENGGSAEVV